MPYALSLYHDQLTAGGTGAAALPAGRRMLYVRHGRATVDGVSLAAGEAVYCEDTTVLAGEADWSQLWRWDLAVAGRAPVLLEADGAQSGLVLSRTVTTLALTPGSTWLFRLDSIAMAAGAVTGRHRHAGPGIRCLLEGAFNLDQGTERLRDAMPGDAWWETGPDTVVAWGSHHMPTRFVRGMVAPPEFEGRSTSEWIDGEPGALRGAWTVFADRVVTL